MDQKQRHISNRDLKVENIPPKDASWQTIVPFALSFSGYDEMGGFHECAEVANHYRQCKTLSDLRACLFFEQRRYRHYGWDPEEEMMAYIAGLLDQIRAKVAAGEIE